MASSPRNYPRFRKLLYSYVFIPQKHSLGFLTAKLGLFKYTLFWKTCSQGLVWWGCMFWSLCDFFRFSELFFEPSHGGQSLTLNSLCPRLRNNEIGIKGGSFDFFLFFFIAESDSGGDFTVRKTYNSPIFHIYINVGEKLFSGLLIDFYNKKRKS